MNSPYFTLLFFALHPSFKDHFWKSHIFALLYFYVLFLKLLNLHCLNWVDDEILSYFSNRVQNIPSCDQFLQSPQLVS